MGIEMDDCYLRDWPSFRLSEILKNVDTKSTFPEPENASEKPGNSKANLVIFSENPRKKHDTKSTFPEPENASEKPCKFKGEINDFLHFLPKRTKNT